jgi:MurNAc alpha-1-phosphate uridylyltransferase
MRAMILAAGRGERMRPLTDHLPKPLLKVAGKPLIVYHIEALVAAGVHDIVINHAWLGHLIEQQLGDGHQFGVRLHYSPEGPTGLETAGGIKQAFGLLTAESETEPFLVVNGDVLTTYPLTELVNQGLPAGALAHLVMVENPPQHPAGDFAFAAERPWLTASGDQQFTFSGIALYHPAFFSEVPPGPQKLAPFLRHAMAKQQISGEIFRGYWADIGTPERLQQADSTFCIGQSVQPRNHHVG